MKAQVTSACLYREKVQKLFHHFWKINIYFIDFSDIRKLSLYFSTKVCSLVLNVSVCICVILNIPLLSQKIESTHNCLAPCCTAMMPCNYELGPWDDDRTPDWTMSTDNISASLNLSIIASLVSLIFCLMLNQVKTL